jgi:L-asparaginase
MMTKRILVLTCGGTIAMSTEQAADRSPMHKASATGEQLLDTHMDQIQMDLPGCKLESEHIRNADSTDLDRDLWIELTTKIRERESEFDGFLVTMGTNTLAYAASALSFLLGPRTTPVVLTGAQIPVERPNSDARNNLVNAVSVLRDFGDRLPGVTVVFGSRIIRGCRAKKVSESALEAFSSYHAPLLGTIGIDTNVDDAAGRAFDEWPIAPKVCLEDNIVSLTLVPGVNPKLPQILIDNGVKGIILRAYGTGDIPEALMPALEYARDREVPIIVTTQCPDGATLVGRNEPGRHASERGIIPALDMSMEAMTTKLMWLLGHGVDYNNLKEYMHRSFVGEVRSHRSSQD